MMIVFHMSLFLILCFEISSPNGVLLFRWLLPQVIYSIQLFFQIGIIIYFSSFVSSLNVQLLTFIKQIIFMFLVLLFCLRFLCADFSTVDLHLFTFHWFSFSMLFTNFFLNIVITLVYCFLIRLGCPWLDLFQIFVLNSCHEILIYSSFCFLGSGGFYCGLLRALNHLINDCVGSGGFN